MENFGGENNVLIIYGVIRMALQGLVHGVHQFLQPWPSGHVYWYLGSLHRQAISIHGIT